MVKAKTLEESSSRKKRLRGGEDSDLCRHDFEDNVLESSRDSVEDIQDEIQVSNPSEFRDPKISNCPKDMHLPPERWKYKTRKKRKKTEEFSDSNGTRVFDDNESVDNSNDVELQKIKTKYIKMNKTARQSPYGKELYKIINGPVISVTDSVKVVKNGLDSTGNSETMSSSSDDNKRRLKHSWKMKTATQECDICGKEMLRSRMKKHVKLAHKSRRIYPCDECSFNAENLIELKKHLRKRHKLSIGTVTKMIKLMKMNRKHRMSVLEDEGEPAQVRRVASLGGSRIIQDELHHTSDSELERRARAGVRTNYKELSFDDDDWNEALNEDTSSETGEESLEESNDEDGDEETRDESHDSGRETQTNTEMSADETESSKPDIEVEKEVEENVEEKLADILGSMRTLTEAEKAKPGEKFYSKEQKELLFSYFNIRNIVTKEHQEVLGARTGIDPKRVYFWFDNSRRTQLKNAKRAEQKVQSSAHSEAHSAGGEREKRQRRPRPASPPLPTVRTVVANNKSGTVLEYDESLITRSSRTVEDIISAGDEALCVGVDLSAQHQRCLLCNYSCSFRGNLYKHLRQHNFEPKFCALPRAKTELGPEVKGCRKTFSLETFDLHYCNADVPQCFGDAEKVDKRYRSGVASSCYSSGEEEESEAGDGAEVVENMRRQGGGVCLGYEVNDSCTKCLLCDTSMPCRANLYKHINTHGYVIKFCSVVGRDKSELSDPAARGCRKIFIEDTFDDHVCNETEPEQIGHWPLQRNQGKKKNKIGGRKKTVGGFRGFEKNFGTPDGSPAKYYNDRYTRLFHQLAVRTNIGLSLDTTFIRNGKMELCYLSDTQMSAVKDYLDDNDTYELVRTGS